MPSFILVRTDSIFINPSKNSIWHDPAYPIGEVIMSPRKKASILLPLYNEIENHPKFKSFKSKKNDNSS